MIVLLGRHAVGPGRPCLVVAEIGINHGGSIATALEMVRAAAKAGADAIKVQAFSASNFVTEKATYQGERQIDLFRRYELSAALLSEIADECQRQGLLFFGTPDSVDQARFLVALGVPCIKVGSDDIVHVPLLRALARFKLPMILSSGMATLKEIIQAVDAVRGVPVIMLHCVSAYPTPPAMANLRRIQSLAGLHLTVGYSDHTDGIEAAVQAVASGAVLVEKHFTMDRAAEGPDHAFSADPAQLAEMVRRIREAEVLRGDGIIEPSTEEKLMRVTARRSIVAARPIKYGDVITDEMLAYKRPGDGLTPIVADLIVGKKARRTLAADEQLREGDWL